MLEIDVRDRSLNNKPPRFTRTLRSVVRTVEVAFNGLREWLFPVRRYQPERRYMRGSRAGASAKR